MNTIRMLAFVAAVLITAFLFRMIADGFTAEQSIHPAPAVVATGAGASDGPQSAAD
jgi:hypothetical protein